jgi:tetratricopeptide (TPR) repeat protein
MLLWQIGDFAAAGEAFEQAAAIQPSYVKALVKLGLTWREMGRSEEALEAFHRALKPEERQINLHYQLGLLFAQYNRFDLAVESFEASLAEKEAAEFRHKLALALQNTGMVDRAAATWNSICELSRGGEPVSGRDHLETDRDVRHP